MALANPRFDASYERLFGPNVALGPDADRFFTRFYELFLARPGVAPFFAATDFDRQIGMMKRSLVQLAAYHVLGEESEALRRLAEVHHALGIPDALFDEWLASLVATVKEFDPECDEATEIAWCWAMTPGLTYMRNVS